MNRASRLGLTPAFVAFLVALAGLPVVLFVTLLNHSEHQSLREAEEFSRVITVFRSYYARNVTGRILAHNGPVTVTEGYHDIEGAIPIPATLSIELGEAIRSSYPDNSFAFSFVSDAPFLKRSRPPLDGFQAQALNAFRNDKQQRDFWRVENHNGVPQRMRFAVPVRMEAVCVACHNGHPDSPVRTWKVGDVRGIQDISIDISLTSQISESVLLGSYLLFFVGATLMALREYRRGNRSLLALNTDLADSRQRLEQAAQQLHSTLEQQNVILDTAHSGIALLDAERRMVAANRRMHDMLGNDGAVSTDSAQVLGGLHEAAGQALEAAQATLLRGEAYTFEHPLRRRDGSTLWVRIAVRSVDPQDPDKGTVWVMDDMTAEHETAQALKNAKELAEQTALAKSSFLANMSHEIRTPMNAVLGMTYLALQTELTSRQREYLSKIQGAGQHLLGVINDILDFSKIEAGRVQLEQIPFDLSHTLDNAIAMVEGVADAKGLMLTLDLHPQNPGRMIGSPQHLTQVLVNLLSNAIKFTERGGVRVSVSCEPEADGHHLRIQGSVIDTGIGIRPEHLSRLFNSFEQGDGSTTRKFGGTGLGLSICKSLCQMMEGDISVSSIPGKGSTFAFHIRVKKEESGGLPGNTPVALSPASSPATRASSADVILDADAAPASVPEPADSVAPVLDDSTQALAIQLLMRLDTGDTEAIELAHQQQAVLAAWMGERHPAFVHALDAFDFETAHSIIEKALGRTSSSH